jgi:hypothetical protein
VQICAGNEWKNAFSATTVHYKYLVMPVVLSNAPSVFQAFINEVLQDMLGQGVVVYIDKILVYSADHVQHVSLVRYVPRRLLAHDLYAKQRDGGPAQSGH